jgi:ethanolaminephosphotransferase
MSTVDRSRFDPAVPDQNELTLRLAETAAHECVSEEALSHLKTYKYSSVDNSMISKHILRHYWNGAVKLLPMWLAPNMVTLIGFGFILFNVVCLEIWIPDLVGPSHPLLYFSFAFGLWMYSTMDNIDGKQARRTGQSSGLGELFDHGIDSLNCTLGSLCETAAMGLGHTQKGAFTALIPCLPMFFSTWETYHTHTLYLGYFNGPTEGLIIACSFMALSGYFGPHIWKESISDLLGHKEIFGDYTVIDIWIPVLLFSFFVAHLPECVRNVVKARRAKGLPVAPVFLDWTPMVIYTSAVGAWLYSPYSNLLKDERLVLFCLTMSFVFGRMTTKIILAHLTRQPFPYWTVMLAPLIGGALLANLPRFGYQQITAVQELWYLRAYFVFALVVYFRWAFLVINSICNYLGINCLTITPKPAPGQNFGNHKSPLDGNSRYKEV